MLRVAAAENPNVKWGGQDISAYDSASGSPAKALSWNGSSGDVFGTSKHVSLCSGSSQAALFCPNHTLSPTIARLSWILAACDMEASFIMCKI